MTMMDKLKELIGKSPDKANQGVDKAASAADEKTGGKYSDKIDKGSEQAHNYVDKQGEQGQQNQDPNQGDNPDQGR